ncbi:MAG: isoprenylcysteine carboxylmethyltransferase family protein [Acidobacteriota bacterium]|nr:isoprenylcysteine carboxylmethyltransferase family protein [Acidobacteriota bacterium]
MPVNDKRLIDIIYPWRVRSGTFLIAAIILLAKPTWKSVACGAAITLFGLVIRTWAAGHLRKEKELAVSGPYQYTRNPLYLGNFFLVAGIGAGACSWWVAGLLAAYFLTFYPLIIRKEVERMRELFPAKYEAYKKMVPLFFPTLKTRSEAKGPAFSWTLYRKNKEYRALAGVAGYWIIMILKIVFVS